MLVTTKKKIYLCEYGVVEEGTEVDVSYEIIEQFGDEVFIGIPVPEEETPVEYTEEKPKTKSKGKKAEETEE
jgi:hypothetical protein